MKIICLSHFFPPDITAAAFRIGDTVNILSQSHKLTVLAGVPHKVSFGGNSLEDYDNAHFAKVNVCRCHIADVESESGRKQYLKHYLSFVYSSFGNGVKLWWSGEKADVIFATSPPLFVGISAYLLSWLFWAPLVFEVRDIWPDSAVSAGQLRKNSLSFRIGRFLERFLYNRASAITCVAEPMKNYIQSQTRRPVTVVYNGVKESDIPATDRSVPASDPRILLYAGNMGSVQNLDLIVAVFAELVTSKQLIGWQLQLLGSGVKEPELRQQISDLNADQWVSILEPVEKRTAYEKMSSASILYLSLLADDTLRHTIPSKVFDYMAVGRPILGGIFGEGAQILQQLSANRVFEPSNAAALKEALIEMTSKIETLLPVAQANQKLLREQFSREASVAKLDQVLQQVAKV